MYYDNTSDDEDLLPVQSLESFTVNNNREQNNDYSTCILVGLVDGKIQTCEHRTCMQHFNVDQKYHKNKLKTTIPVIDKNVQVPCNGQITCHALNNFGVICKPEVGHLHVKMGSGKSLFDCEKFGLHNSDHSTSLDLLETQEMEAKNSSSKAVIEILTISDLLYTKVPSPFVLKALETLGVKFIKGFINGNAIDEDNMKSLISAAQTKHERIGVLFSEYLNDATTPHGTGAIKTHKETIWDLFNHLLDTLNVADNRALECNLWKIKTLCIESYWSATTF
ncbi:20228_t:CDS:2 [Entrophospora sp. SA101]|nr:20228_t:CDS:2 [Entrophospora sp. SA101]